MFPTRFNGSPTSMGAMEEADREVVWGRWTVMGEKGKGIDPKSE